MLAVRVAALLLIASPLAAQVWTRTVKVDPLTDQPVLTLMRPAAEPVRIRGRWITSAIAIICKREQGAAVSLRTGDVVEPSIIMRWDKEMPDTTGLWTETITGTLAADYPNAIIEQLATHTQLLVRYFPVDAPAVTTRFAIPSLRPHARDLLVYCNLDLLYFLDGDTTAAARLRRTH